MANRDFEFFIAQRLKSVRESRKNRIMIRVATLSTAVSVAVMIIAISVIMGFKNEISSKMVGFDAHLQVVNLDNNSSYETIPIQNSARLRDSLLKIPAILSVSPYAYKAGVLRNKDLMQGIVLKGVDSTFNSSFFANSLVKGTLPNLGYSSVKEILISQKVADNLLLDVGSKIETVFMQDPPRRDLFTVTGIYNSSLSEYDNLIALTSLRNTARLNNWGDSLITGYEIYIQSFDNLMQVKKSVEEVVFSYEDAKKPMMVTDVKERTPSIFEWLDLQDTNIVVIISIMIFVACFNMATMMMMLIFQKTQLIGLLSALGAKRWSIQKIFVLRSAYITFNGVVIGNIIGLSLAYIQKRWSVVSLNEEGYMLSHVPISIEWSQIVLLSVGAFFLIVLIQILPTFIVSNFSPDKSIKYKE